MKCEWKRFVSLLGRSIYLLALPFSLPFALLCQVCWLILMRTYGGGLPGRASKLAVDFFISNNFYKLLRFGNWFLWYHNVDCLDWKHSEESRSGSRC